MRWPVLAIGFLLLAASARRPDPNGLSPEQGREDLRYLRAALLQLHPGVERYGTRAELDGAFAKLEASLGKRTSLLRFFEGVASLSTVIRDGHTRFRLPTSLEKQAEAWPVLPLQVQVARDRLHVSRDCGEPAATLEGGEILAIDGVPAAALVARATALRPRDGFNETYPRWALGRSFAFGESLNVLLGPSVHRRVEIASAGSQRTVVVAGRLRRDLRGCEEASDPRPSGLRFRDDGRIAVLAIPSFIPDLTHAYRDWFETLAHRGTKALVIDLRDNGGGLDRNGSRLFGHLSRTPFRYYEAIVVNTLQPAEPFTSAGALLRPWRIERVADGRLQFSGHECLGLQHPETPGFEGAVVVLVNGGTFSAASEFAAVAASQGRATFVGEETGGAANGNTAGVSAELALPSSGIRVQVPMMRYELSTPGQRSGRGVIPDAEVAPTVGDLLARRDVAGERALALAREEIEQEEGR